MALPVFLGMLVLQASWILTVWPFRGSDEIDHSNRAAAVADGEWVSRLGRAPRGRGDLVRVPGTLVAAAAPVCESLSYMSHDNCHAAARVGHGEVLAASAAAHYNPLYYWVVGTLAKPFTGAAATYAMRVGTAVGCAVLVAAAAWATALGTRTRWPTASLVVALTPVGLFSTSIVAPNGPELAAALLLWCSLLALARPGARQQTDALLVLAGASTCLLVTLRSIGPLWALLVIVTAAAALGPAEVISVVRRARRRVVAGVLLSSAVATAASVAWTLNSGQLGLEPYAGRTGPGSRRR